jgi:anti-sigma factor RsiW
MDRLLSLYVGGDLSEKDAARVEEHLAECESCRELLASFETSRQSLFALKGAAGGAGPDLWQDVRRRVAGRRPRKHAVPLRAAVAVLVAIGLSLGFALLGPGAAAPPAPPGPAAQVGPPAFESPPSGPGDGEFFLAEVGTSSSSEEAFGHFPSVRPVDPDRRDLDRF